MLARDYVARKEREFKERHPELAQEPAGQAPTSDIAQRELAVRDREWAVYGRELAVWHREQVARWEERKRQAEADGKDFTEPMPEPPPGVNSNGHNP